MPNILFDRNIFAEFCLSEITLAEFILLIAKNSSWKHVRWTINFLLLFYLQDSDTILTRFLDSTQVRFKPILMQFSYDEDLVLIRFDAILICSVYVSNPISIKM